MSTAWWMLLAAGLLEVGWALGMKHSDGFRKPGPAAVTIALMIVSFALLAMAVQRLPVGTAYAVWTGIGAAGTAIAGMVWLGEPAGAVRIGCLLLILAGTIGLKFSTHDQGDGHEAAPPSSTIAEPTSEATGKRSGGSAGPGTGAR